MLANNPIQFIDAWGHAKPSKKCRFTIVADHGYPPNLGQSSLNDFLKSIERQYGNGDRLGAVGCFSGDIEKGLVNPITSGCERYDDPSIPNFVPDPSDPSQEVANKAEPGFTWVNELVSLIITEIKAAETQAEKDCFDPQTCCKEISIEFRGRPTIYPGTVDVGEFLRKTEEGRKVYNYKNTYDCKHECPVISSTATIG
jgi:hypothetical protein